MRAAVYRGQRDISIEDRPRPVILQPDDIVIRVRRAAVRGAHPSEEMFRGAGLAAARQARPAEDRRGPVDYKLAMVREMTARALRLAAERAAMNV